VTLRVTGADDPRPGIEVLALIDHLSLGGAQLLLSQFAAAAPLEGVEFSVASLTDRDGNPAAHSLRAVGIEPVNLDAIRLRPGPETFRTVRGHFVAAKPDLIHTHLGTADWIGGLAARSLGVPAICTIHTSIWGRDLEQRTKRLVVDMCAARVIAVSDNARRAYEAVNWTKDHQVVTVHNGVDVVAVPGSGREVRSRLGWHEDDLVVGMISALRPEKAHDLAIEAIALLEDQFPALRLLIVGEGPAQGKIASLALGLRERVAMIGLTTDVMRFFDACDVCLHPSHADAFPTTLIEAMAAGVPVLSSAAGGIPEMITTGKTGIVMPGPPAAPTIARELGALLRDPGRRAALAEAAREAYAQRFTAGRWLRDTRTVYDAVLAESRLR
jgi:glycosyltransferase involved in cell wall biosynthesis